MCQMHLAIRKMAQMRRVLFEELSLVVYVDLDSVFYYTCFSFTVLSLYVHTYASGLHSYNNERSGILIFYFESVSSLSNKKIVKRFIDGHLSELSPLASFSTAGGCLFCGTVKSRM